MEKLELLLSKVFIKNENLKFVRLYGFHTLTGECLLSLNENSIEEIGLRSSNKIEGNYFIKTLPYFFKLHTISFYDLSGINFDQFFESIGLCSKLKMLFFNDFKNCSRDNLIKLMSLSKNIELLKFNSMKIGVLNKCLFNFVSSTLPNLKYLDISYNTGITDNDLEPLCNLGNLEELDISNNYTIAGSKLFKFSNLKKLCCASSYKINDFNLIRFLKSADNLELLDIRGCEQISSSTINAAIEITKKRTNNLILEINLNFNRINFNEVKEKSPLLHLDEYVRFKRK